MSILQFFVILTSILTIIIVISTKARIFSQRWIMIITSFGLMLNLLLGCSSTKPDWEATKRNNTIEAYEDFVTKHPDSEYSVLAKSAIDSIAWRRTKSENSIESYKEFIQNFGNSSHVTQARKAIDSLYWELAQKENSLKGYWLYMQTDGSKEFSAEAKKMIIQKTEKLVPINLAALQNSISQLISPFTLDEISSKISGKVIASRLNINGIMMETYSKARTVDELNLSVTVARINNSGKMKVEIYHRLGKISLSDMYNGDIGNQVLEFSQPVSRSETNPIGFNEVSFYPSQSNFMNGDFKGTYIIVGDKAYVLK